MRRRVEAVVGARYVLADPEHRALHSRTTVPSGEPCALVVRPGSADQIGPILKIAADAGLEVWPFSGGRNWGYGTKSALRPGALVLLLDRMNRILEVDPELAYAVIEPGVTQQQLANHLAVHHPQLMPDCTDSTPYGSVLGNAIERGYGYTPHGDHFAGVCGLDVVLADGREIRCGANYGASRTRYLHKWGVGPALEGLFSQSNLGVVVRGGIWLMPRPPSVDMFTVSIDDDAGFAPAVDRIRQLSLRGVIRCHPHMVNDFQLLSLLEPTFPSELADARGVLGPDALARLRRRYRIPRWSMVGGLYGDRRTNRLHARAIRRAFAGIGRVEHLGERTIRALSALTRGVARPGAGPWLRAMERVGWPKHPALLRLVPELYRVLRGSPTERVIRSAYFMSARRPPAGDLDPARDGGGLAWVAPAIPATGPDAARVLSIARAAFAEHAINLSACFTRMNDRTFFALFGVMFDRDRPDQVERARALVERLGSRFSAAGYALYRGGTPHFDRLAQDEGSTLSVLRDLKGALDPRHTLAPGRYIP